MIWLYLLITISLLANIVQGFVNFRLFKRLLQYDDIYQFFIDDIETNLKQFERMRKLTFLSDDDEIRAAHRNMMVMAARLDEFIARMEEVSGLKLRKTTQQMKPINVTKEAERLSV